MIVGTGIDMVEVARVRAAIERYGRRFLERVFTPAEIRYCQSRKNAGERFAGRFAAKEAALKALGTGLRGGISWRDVEISREPAGRPVIHFAGKAAEFAVRLGSRRASVSISHTAEQAIACVVLED